MLRLSGMIDGSFMTSLGIIVIAASVFAMAAKPVRLPSIVAFLLAGLTVGPLMGLVELSEALDLISEVGVVLLLFLVGLELNIDKIKDVGRSAFIVGLGQVSLTFAGGFVVGSLLGFETKTAVFVAIILSFSSTAVGVKLLETKRETDLFYGRLAIGILLVQDLLVILLLTFLSGIGDGSNIELSVIGKSLIKAFGSMALLAGATAVLSRYILPRAFSWAARSQETLFIWSLCWCFLVVFGAHVFHLSAESGAFLAGFCLAQLPYHVDLQRRVQPLMNFFIAVFFVSLGVKMNPGAAIQNLSLVAGLSIFILIGKFLFVFAFSLVAKHGRETGFLTATVLCQVSEFSFICAAIGSAQGLIDEATVSIVGAVGLVTISISALIIQSNRTLAAVCERQNLLDRFPSKPHENVKPHQRRKGHIIVVGMNALGRVIAQRLIKRGEPVVAIDTDPGKLKGLSCDCLLGDASYVSVLDDADFKSAKLLVSAVQIENVNDQLAFRCRAAGLPSAIHAIDLSVMDNLLEMDATFLMLPKVDGVKLQNKILREKGYLDG